jgi:uncharacterized protein (DUF433 family)
MTAGAAKIAHPCIVNTRIRVSYLVDMYKQYVGDGMTDDEAFAEVWSNYDFLKREEVEAVFDYWHDNRDEIEREILQDQATSTALEMLQRSLEQVYGRR